MDLPEITAWSQIAQSVSVILAAVFAIFGFDAWRREHIGKRRMELAEEILALFYQARDAIDSIRSPFGFGGEGATRKPGPDEKPEHKDALDQAYVLIERYNRHSELFSKLYALRYRFMAQIGIEAAAPFDALGRIVSELIVSAQTMARLTTLPAWSVRTDEAAAKIEKQLLEVHSVYYGGGEDDPIAPRLKRLVEEMEYTCRGVIESKGTLFGLFNLRLWERRS